MCVPCGCLCQCRRYRNRISTAVNCMGNLYLTSSSSYARPLLRRSPPFTDLSDSRTIHSLGLPVTLFLCALGVRSRNSTLRAKKGFPVCGDEQGALGTKRVESHHLAININQLACPIPSNPVSDLVLTEPFVRAYLHSRCAPSVKKPASHCCKGHIPTPAPHHQLASGMRIASRPFCPPPAY